MCFSKLSFSRCANPALWRPTGKPCGHLHWPSVPWGPGRRMTLVLTLPGKTYTSRPVRTETTSCRNCRAAELLVPQRNWHYLWFRCFSTVAAQVTEMCLRDWTAQSSMGPRVCARDKLCAWGPAFAGEASSSPFLCQQRSQPKPLPIFPPNSAFDPGHSAVSSGL